MNITTNSIIPNAGSIACFGNNAYGEISAITVIKYANPVYAAASNGFFTPSCFVDKYSEDAIDNVADIPVIRPINVISLLSLNANEYPASAPVNSTIASFIPKTIELTY